MAIRYEIFKDGSPITSDYLMDYEFLSALVRMAETFMGKPVEHLWKVHSSVIFGRVLYEVRQVQNPIS